MFDPWIVNRLTNFPCKPLALYMVQMYQFGRFFYCFYIKPLRPLHKARLGSICIKNPEFRHSRETVKVFTAPLSAKAPSGSAKGVDPFNCLIKMDPRFASIRHANCLLNPLRGNDEILSFDGVSCFVQRSIYQYPSKTALHNYASSARPATHCMASSPA